MGRSWQRRCGARGRCCGRATSMYRPSMSVYRPSMSSYRPSLSAYRPFTCVFCPFTVTCVRGAQLAEAVRGARALRVCDVRVSSIYVCSSSIYVGLASIYVCISGAVGRGGAGLAGAARVRRAEQQLLARGPEGAYGRVCRQPPRRAVSLPRVRERERRI